MSGHNHTTHTIDDSSRDQSRWLSLLEILLAFAPILVFGIIGTKMGPETISGGMVIDLGYVISLIVIGALLKWRGSHWRDIGLARPNSWPRTILLALGAWIGALVVVIMVQIIALNLPGGGPAPIDESRFNPLAGNLPLLLLLIVMAWTVIAFGEELFYRAFLITRLGAFFQHTKIGWILAAIGSAVIFGLVHVVEGPLGIVSNGAFGLLFAWIYLRTERNLWVLIIAHGLLNTLRFLTLYFAG